jgi:hypothetical protein
MCITAAALLVRLFVVAAFIVRQDVAVGVAVDSIVVAIVADIERRMCITAVTGTFHVIFRRMCITAVTGTFHVIFRMMCITYEADVIPMIFCMLGIAMRLHLQKY